MKNALFYLVVFMALLLSCSLYSKEVGFAITNQSGVHIDSMEISIPSAKVVAKNLKPQERMHCILPYNSRHVPKEDGSFMYKIYIKGNLAKSGSFGYYTNGSVDLFPINELNIRKDLLVEETVIE